MKIRGFPYVLIFFQRALLDLQYYLYKYISKYKLTVDTLINHQNLFTNEHGEHKIYNRTISHTVLQLIKLGKVEMAINELKEAKFLSF